VRNRGGVTTETFKVLPPAPEDPDEDEDPEETAEHFAFCTDNITHGQGSIADYAEELPGATSWWLWWD
jgi:hypothetical protein